MDINRFQLRALATKSDFYKVLFSLFLTFPSLLCAKEKLSEQKTSHYQVQIGDSQPRHVYPPGQAVTITIKVSSDSLDDYQPKRSSPLNYQWQDINGNSLSDKTVLPINEVIAARAPILEQGYLALVIASDQPNVQIMDREINEPMRFGFVIRDPNQKRTELLPHQSQFGLVHTESADPDAPIWLKTMTWHTTPAEWWQFEIQRRRDRGFEELPIATGEFWQTEDDQPVTEKQLENMAAHFRDYLGAAPDVAYWELGIEENLSNRFRQPYYWSNLALKTQRFNAQKKPTGSEAKLIYQIAETRIEPVRSFLRSNAAREFDILSLHPYAWPDFPDPESWLPTYMTKIRSEMRAAHRTMPIWFTEVGAPLRGHTADHFFGYPSSNVEVPGFTDAQSVEYVIKLHVVALQEGVEKIFWYNYRDREVAREYAENHFGLVDYRGFPKPIYAAYMQLIDLLNGKKSVQKVDHKDTSIAHYRFENTDREHDGQVEVIWLREPQKKSDYNLTDFIGESQSFTISGSLGETILPEKNPDGYSKITLRSTPIFIQVSAE